MSRRSKRIMGLVQKQLPGSVLCGDFLSLEKTGIILRGFGLYETGRKNHTNLHRSVVPLWRPLDSPMSHYDKHLHHPTTGWTIIDEKDHAKSAATILWQIAPLVDDLKKIQTAEDFREHFAFMRPNPTMYVKLDFALADYLADDLNGFEAALSSVEDELAKHDATRYSELRKVVTQIRRQLDDGPEGVGDLIQRWRNENVARLNLASSC